MERHKQRHAAVWGSISPARQMITRVIIWSRESIPGDRREPTKAPPLRSQVVLKSGTPVPPLPFCGPMRESKTC